METRPSACPQHPAMTPVRSNFPSSAVMVVHGPEIFDQGEAAWLIRQISPRRTIVAGVMARTAAEESGLPVEYDGRPPSRVITDNREPVFLASRGKTPHSGLVFGDIVASRVGARGLVHIECSDGKVYCWNGGDRSLSSALSELTGFSVFHMISTARSTPDLRQIRGCIMGEPVYVNGIVIGHATDETVVIRSECSGIVAVSGLNPKPHGMEKLAGSGPVDIATAWCKSGSVRSAPARHGRRQNRSGQVVLIDHCGHSVYTRLERDCCGVLAIGDDTTAVCGHICVHRGIPVLGITDGDADGIVPASFAPGSLVLDTRPARDDDIGREIAERLPAGRIVWDDWVQDVLDRYTGRVAVVLDLREPRP